MVEEQQVYSSEWMCDVCVCVYSYRLKDNEGTIWQSAQDIHWALLDHVDVAIVLNDRGRAVVGSLAIHLQQHIREYYNHEIPLVMYTSYHIHFV